MLEALAEYIQDAIRQGGTPEEIAARACMELRRHFGAERHYIPAPGTEARDARIMEARKAGSTVREIAKDVDCSIATVSRVITKKNRQNTGFGSSDWVL